MISAIRRHVVFFHLSSFNLIDLSGPLDAFALANDMAPESYRFTIMSLEGGEIESWAGAKIKSEVAVQDGIDTLVIVGDAAMTDRKVPPEMINFIRAAATGARRTASVCMGAFLLAASGLLDGRRATTHWRFAAKLQAMYPAVRVEGDRLFLNERGVWTSAGMTAGIYMTLALIEDDLGREMARAAARMLVVYYQRPGGQMQYSSLLDIDPGSDRIRCSLIFAREHLPEPLSVERLAEVACLSVRQFSRAFVLGTGMTPAKAIERLARHPWLQSQAKESRRTTWRLAHARGRAGPA